MATDIRIATTTDLTIADCDDSHPTVTPDTERWIPAGVFTRGDDIAPGAGPVHDIYLSDYCMDVTEVTNADFVEFMVHQAEIEAPTETMTATHSLTLRTTTTNVQKDH